MPIWSGIATWHGPSPNTSGQIADHMYVVVHTADGTYEGTIAWQKNSSADVSSHFIVAKNGRIAQMLDTNAKSWTQISGNPYSISIENEGNENTPLTPQQIEANAKILARVHQFHGVPLRLTGKVGVRGLGHHSMGAESGADWGHSACPGPIIKGQKAAILACANQIVGGAQPPLTTGGPNVFVLQRTGDAAQYLVGLPGGPLHYGPSLIAAFAALPRVTLPDNAQGVADLGAILIAAKPPAAATLNGAQLEVLAAAIIGHADTPLGNADIPAIVKALQQADVVATLTAAARKAVDGRLDDNAAT